jgi:hypothetical protein
MDEFWKGFSILIKEKASIDRPVELIDEACPECGNRSPKTQQIRQLHQLHQLPGV